MCCEGAEEEEVRTTREGSLRDDEMGFVLSFKNYYTYIKKHVLLIY